MQRHIIQIGNELLRTKSNEIDLEYFNSTKFETLKSDLLDTLRAQKLGIAISAVQIAEPYRLFLIEIIPRPNQTNIKAFGPKFFINPEITSVSDKTKSMVEGCLSVFNSELFGSVVRPEKIVLKYLDETFTEITEEYDGMFARAIQHEIDHLNGILFTDIVDTKSISSLEEYKKARNKL